MAFESNASGGDWAMAAEVFRKYDADGSGRLDRSELLAALRECGLLAGCSAASAGRALADMDTNGDGQVSFEEFRSAYSRLAKLKAAEQRQARLRGRSQAPAVPPNAAVDPRLRAAFHLFASHGTAKGLAERTPRGGADGMGSRQFQRACTATGLPLESGMIDVVFVSHCSGRARTLSFPRFLDALAQVAHEGGVALDTVLDAIRSATPAAAASAGSPAGRDLAAGKPPSCASPRPQSASQRPKSPGPDSCKSAGRVQQAVRAMTLLDAAAAPQAAPPEADEPSPAGPPSAKLQQRVGSLQQLLEQRVVSLQQLLEEGPEGEEGDGSILAHHALPPCGPAPEAKQAQLNPTFQPKEGGDLAALRLDLLTLLDQRCEAAERSCTALVATRAQMTQALLAQCAAALGTRGTSAGRSAEVAAASAEAQEALAAACRLEGQLAALDGRLSAAVRQVGQECRAAVSVVEAQLDVLQRQHDAGMKQTNDVLLAIARRVGALAGPPQQKQ